MKRNFEEIESIMKGVNTPSASSTAISNFTDRSEFTGDGWWERWNEKNSTDLTLPSPSDLPPNFTINRKSFDLPESKLSDIQFARHFKHDLRLNVTGVVCKTCSLLLEEN